MTFFFFAFLQGKKKLAKLSKLHHKLSNGTCLHSFLKMAPLGIKFTLFCTHGKPLVQNRANSIPSVTHRFKSRAKKSYLYFCHEIVFLKRKRRMSERSVKLLVYFPVPFPVFSYEIYFVLLNQVLFPWLLLVIQN